MASIDSSLAESMKAQVLTTSTSASSAFGVICMPRSSTLPSMISASTRFFAQPRLIIPTVVRRGSVGALFKFYVVIAGGDSGSVFCDLHRAAIQDFQRDSFSTEGKRRVGWVQPAVKRWLRLTIDRHADVGFAKGSDLHAMNRW